MDLSSNPIHLPGVHVDRIEKPTTKKEVGFPTIAAAPEPDDDHSNEVPTRRATGRSSMGGGMPALILGYIAPDMSVAMG